MKAKEQKDEKAEEAREENEVGLWKKCRNKT